MMSNSNHFDNYRPQTAGAQQNNHHHTQRPRTASESGARFGSQSMGKLFQTQNQNGASSSGTLDEKTVSSIWRAFGSYIAKQLRNGKGIFVPRFGNFTFSATLVDLAGTTNPGERDKQFREPVFIVGKDFVSAVPLRAGVAHNKGAQVRPYDIKGASGIIPKVKINYTEVGVHCSQSKDLSKNGCEQVFRFLSDKVRKGESVAMELPYVGTFIVRGGIAAFAFIDDLSEETKGVTAKNHFVNKLFASSVNQLNLKVNDQSKAKENPSTGLGGAMRITGDAEQWLRNNLDISVPELSITQSQSRDNLRIQSANPLRTMNRYGSLRPEDLRNKAWAIQNNQGQGLTEQNKIQFDRMSEQKTGPLSKRPMSAVTRITSASRVSNIPDIGRMKLMLIANDIYRNRQGISDSHIQCRGQLRDLLSSSEIQQILKRVGIYLEIGHIKALLKEFGYNFNGKSCSLVQLFQSVQQFIYGSSQKEDQNGYELQMPDPKGFQSEPQQQSRKQKTFREARIGDQIQQIKDLFYSTGKTLYEIYQEARLGQTIDFDGFRKVIQEFSNLSVSEQDILAVFQHVARGSDVISYQEFEKGFKWALPAGGEWETKCIRAIREWMFKNGYSSETVFELFLKKVDRILQKRISRAEFHRVMNSFDFRFTAPEIDGLFKVLDTKQDGELDIQEWTGRIYEDSQNPLQMLREVVQNNRITSDDLLFKMQMRIWDEPLDFPRLCEGLRRLDPTISEPQLRHLAKTLKNKDNKVEITTLLRNLCGQEHETVDFRNKIFRQIYSEIHPHKEEKLLQLLEDADPLNDGRVEPQGLKAVLKKIVTTVDDDSIDRFIRFLDKDKSGKVKYMEFLQRMGEVSNRDHNPFKSVMQRIAYFIESNKQSISSILRRLMAKCGPTDLLQNQVAVSVSVFAEFLKSKIDKKRSHGELRQYAHYIDIDKDGFISEIDLQTCLNNLNSNTFFKNGGEALAQSAFSSQKKFYPTVEKLSEERARDVAKQIRDALIDKKIAYREAFNRFDENKDGFLSLTEFSQGIDKIITLSIPIKEKLFALMDKNEIGLVDYPNFIEVVNLSSAYKLAKKGNDNFDWENDVIEQIKKWIITERITIEEGFKCFDKDFDGFINKNDLRWSLINILKIKEEEILPTKVDRLFRLIDFYKTGNIQLSDFQRLLNNENPYTASGSRGTPSTDNFRRSFGGSFAQTSTFDWKVSAIQQMGLVLSKKYGSIKESFEIASEQFHKITFEQFKKFIEQNQALAGFNMTLPLIQKLFAELDPHKKGFLTESDWLNAFSPFNYNDQIMIELKNAIQCSFSDCSSAFDFFLTFKKDSNQKTIQYPDFGKAVESLTSNRFNQNEVQKLWNNITQDCAIQSMDKYYFRSVFDNMRYTGNSTVRNIKTAPPGARTTIISQSSSSSTWDVDILEKIRQIIRSSASSLDQIFREFDSDGNGSISEIEFRQSIRKLNLGLTSREIDKLMLRIDTNQDGKIDYNEFMAKFKTNDLDVRLQERAKDKMARLKELMILHMTSPNDAFRFFDESKLGKLTYQEFGKLILKVYQLAGEKAPAYPVIKDLFDTIDIRKDGILDLNEWQQTFGKVVEGSNKLSIKPTPLTEWENTREFLLVGQLIAKNRKILKEEFEKITKGQTSLINFDQGRQGLMTVLKRNYSGIGDDKIRVLLKVGEELGPNTEGIGNSYDYIRMLDVYKSRHAGPQL